MGDQHGAARASSEGIVDVVVVGAGFAGLYLLHRLRERGFSTVVVEAGSDVGGTWFWNRYPGLRCDIPTTDYSYSWDPALEEEWEWSEKFATQPEILRYLQYVADKHDLRRGIRFSTRVVAATWAEAGSTWTVRLDTGEELHARYVVMATGVLSAPKDVDITGAEAFAGDIFSTARWPEEPVDFTGRRVAVIGTGSSGIQVIPVITRQAAEVVVFQRTPAYSLPAHNGPAPGYRKDLLRQDRASYREAARWSSGGVPIDPPRLRAAELTSVEQRERCEIAWDAGEIAAVNSVFEDYITDQAANDVFAEFLRDKIRALVRDPSTASSLCPSDFPFMAKRPCFDAGYYDAFNQSHVRLVDLRREPIVRMTEKGIETTEGEYELDAIVYATGYDAFTGALLRMDIRGRGGRTLRERWVDGPATYLGLMVDGFPNLFTVTGPGSPSVLSNMPVAIEQHVEWITDCLQDMRVRGVETIEPTHTAVDGWVEHVNHCADMTLLPRANSWYVGANVPGKPRVFMPYAGGVGVFRATCEEVAAHEYLGFRLSGQAGTRVNDGTVEVLQPAIRARMRLKAPDVLDAYAPPGLANRRPLLAARADRT